MSSETTVILSGETVTATIYTNDPFAFDFLKGVAETERPAVVTAALISGLRGMAAANGNASIIAMADQVQAAATSAGQHVKAATDAMDQTVKKLVEQFFGPRGKLIEGVEKAGEKAFNPENEHIAKLRRDFAKAAEQAMQPVLKQITSVVNINDEKQPLGAMNRQIREISSAMVEIKTHLGNQAQISAAARRDPIASGRSLEECFANKVGPIASLQGETLEDVRSESGNIERCKAGDFLATVSTNLTHGHPCKVVIESKNRQGESLTALLNELGKAMKNRGADAALGILTNPTAKCGPIFHQNNMVVVSLVDFGTQGADNRLHEELIAVGYEMARFIAIRSVAAPQVDSIDLDRLNECIADLQSASQKFSTLKDNHTRIVSAVDNARATADTIKDLVLSAGSKLRTVIAEETAKIGRSEAA